MGEIRKQGILYSLFSYIGVVLGFVNTVLLYPIVLTEAEIGIIGFILVGGSLMGILGQLGMPSAIIRFFPHYKNKENNHANFLSFALLITLIGTSVALFCSFLLEDVIIQTFSEESSSVLASKYYWLIYALLPFLALFNLLSSYSFNFQKTAITSFFRDVFVRLLVVILLLLCYFNLITFDTL